MASKKIALFIDADNISSRFGKQIIETLESRGEIFIRRIYGNWQKTTLHSWNDCILNFSLRTIQQPDFTTGKNATDLSLTIDSMDVLYDGKANIFALVSNDSDFTPLVIRLRENGMSIIGMGNENASISFRNACNEFIDLDKIQTPIIPITPPAPKVTEQPKPTPIKAPPTVDNKRLQQIHNVLREAAKAHGDLKGFTSLSRAGDALSSNKLSIKGFGHSTLSKFLSAFPNVYEVKGKGSKFSYRCK